MFGHIPEVLGLLVLGLIIFGPKRMIELGGQLGRTMREVRAAMKDMNWNVLGDDSAPTSTSQTTLSRLSQLAQDFTAPRATADAPAEPTRVVEMTTPPAADTPPTSAN